MNLSARRKSVSSPQVSVIMPVYNGENYLAEAIESILTQTFTDFELLIIDDASQDRSLEIIQEYERRDARVRSIRLDRNKGVSAARNRGFDAAGGEYIAFMDSDDVSLPTRLEKQLQLLQENPEIGVVGICSMKVSSDLTDYLGSRIGPPAHPLIVLAIFTGAVFLMEGAIMARRQPMQTVGGWDESLRYGEDELIVRMLFQTSIRFANVSEILYLQRRHDGNKSLHNIPVANREQGVYLRRRLSLLWDEVTDDTLTRFQRLRDVKKLNWSDRRAAKKDMRRLIKSLIERQLVEPADRPLLIADMNRRLEQASPRLWQQFCHWRRHRFPRLFPDTFQMYP